MKVEMQEGRRKKEKGRSVSEVILPFAFCAFSFFVAARSARASPASSTARTICRPRARAKFAPPPNRRSASSATRRTIHAEDAAVEPQLPVSAYTVYSSTSLQAIPGQPTGSSKLCLSCHDGTIAAGERSLARPADRDVGGITTLPPGRSNLGTDLSDDHPISFLYDDALVARATKLHSPKSLPPSVHAGETGGAMHDRATMRTTTSTASSW